MRSEIPLKHKPREQQLQALEEIKRAYADGKRFGIGNMPTGTGKSYEVVMFAHWWANTVEKDTRFTVLTESRMLQEQYIMDFDFMYNIWGRSNYSCHRHHTNCEVGGEMGRLTKSKCHDCPYNKAKDEFKKSTVGLTNYHMHITNHLYQEDFMSERLSASKNVLIVDEAHAFENVFCTFVSVRIDSTTLPQLGFTASETAAICDAIAGMREKSDFVTWLVSDFYADLLVKEETMKQQSELTKGDRSLDLMRRAERAAGMLAKIDYFDTQHGLDPDNWLYQPGVDTRDKSFGELVPIWGRKLIFDTIWRHYDFVVLLSGTIVNPVTFMYMNGIPADMTHYFELGSPFPVENRPIMVFPVGVMNYRNKKEVFERQWPLLMKIATKHKTQKGVFHTQTYEIADWIMKKAKGGKRLLTHTNAREKEAMIREHYSLAKPTIIVSPSVKTGLDLKDHLSRFQVILKVPYPNMGDPRVKKRMEQLPQWYADQTILELVQMYGRSVRSEDDWAHTYILDESFTRLYVDNARSMPAYFKEAIKFMTIKK